MKILHFLSLRKTKINFKKQRSLDSTPHYISPGYPLISLSPKAKPSPGKADSSSNPPIWLCSVWAAAVPEPSGHPTRPFLYALKMEYFTCSPSEGGSLGRSKIGKEEREARPPTDLESQSVLSHSLAHGIQWGMDLSMHRTEVNSRWSPPCFLI